MPRRIRTMLYGDQAIEATELDLLHTPALQRLYDLHQLGLTDRVFIDASHSRLHHVIGVLEQVDNILRALVANLEREPSSRTLKYRLQTGGTELFQPAQLANYIRIRRRSARLMGLLHDLTHAPYGHTLEDEIELHPQKHDHPDRQADAFYRLLLQYVGWLCIDEGQFEGPSHADRPGFLELFRQILESPGLNPPPETQEFVEYVSELASPFLTENKRSRAMHRAPSASELVELFHDLRFAMRALLWIDALHKDKLDDLLPPDPSRGALIRPDGEYLFEKLIDASLRKAGQRSKPEVDRFRLQRDAFLLDVIGNTICADLLDYAKRDSHFAGLRLDYDVDRIVENFTVVSHTKARDIEGARVQAYRTVDPILRTAISIFSHKLRIDVPGELMNLLQVRFYVYQRVLFHPTKCIAGAMLGSAIQLIGWKTLPLQFRYVGDAVFLNHVLECARVARDLLQSLSPPPAVEALSKHLRALYAKLDAIPSLATGSALRELFDTRQQDSTADVVPDLEAAIRLLQRLGARRYHRGVFRLLPNASVPRLNINASQVATIFVDPTDRAVTEREIERRCGLPRGSVTIHCPRSDGPKKIAEILIVSSNRDGSGARVHPLRGIGEIDPVIFSKHQEAITAVEEMYKSMWRLIVSVAPPYVEDHSRLNKRIGRVLFSVLSREPYERIYGTATEEELDGREVSAVPNDERMEAELRISAEEHGRDGAESIELLYPDGHHEARSLAFQQVADQAVERLREVNPTIDEFVERGLIDATMSQETVVKDLVNDAIQAPAPRPLELFREPVPSGLIAARVTTPPEPMQAGGRDAESPTVLFTDEQVFRAKMHELASGKTGLRRSETLLGWAQTGGLLPLARYPAAVRFLDFLYATLKQHYGPTWAYSPKHLTRWFTEFNAGQQLGTKL